MHLYRIVYVGEHDSECLDDLQQFFSVGTAQVNFKSDESQDVLCALLIHYAKHFILMLEVYKNYSFQAYFCFFCGVVDE